jgi:hypothetical protein
MEKPVGEWIGVAIALLSSCLGGTAAAITRYLTGGADPIALAVLRWGIGFVCLLPAALLLKAKWPARNDLPAVAALGVCFFGLFFILYKHRDFVHDRGARVACARHAAAFDHGGGGAARRRAADVP